MIQTKDDILKIFKANASSDYMEEEREIKAIKKDIGEASAIIKDGIARYRKKKLRARSKAAATENPFAELEGYESKRQIQDDYGWGLITENRMYKLWDLWDLREESKSKEEYTDRVIEMLELARRCLMDPYFDKIEAFEQKERDMAAEAEKVARENNEREWNRKHGMEV